MDGVRDPNLRAHINRLLHTETKHETYKLDVLAAVCSARLEAINSNEELTKSSARSPSTMPRKENCDDPSRDDCYSEEECTIDDERVSWMRSTKDTWFTTLIDNDDSSDKQVKEELLEMPPLFGLFQVFGSRERRESHVSFEPMESSIPIESPHSQAQHDHQSLPSEYSE